MSEKLWKRIEPLNLPRYIKNNDSCFHARDYISGGGYTSCETNQLISNFKKPLSKKKKEKEWWHRNQAVRTFKSEVAQFFMNPKIKTKLNTITAIPSSKIKDHSEYDNRFEDLFNELKKTNLNLFEEWPVKIKNNIEASHRGGERTPESIKANYIWEGFKKRDPKILFVFDDIITTGAHFRAMSDFLRDNKYEGYIVGLIWARAKQEGEDFFKMTDYNVWK